MNDTLYEQLVTRDSKPTDMLIYLLVIGVTGVLILFGMPLIGILAILLAIVWIVCACYFIFPKLKVEYEYTLLNHELAIDVIYSKSSRKSKLSLDIQQAEIIAPNDSPRLNSYHPSKTLDYSSGNKEHRIYAIIAPVSQSVSCILIEPDETMLKQMKGWMGMKMFTD